MVYPISMGQKHEWSETTDLFTTFIVNLHVLVFVCQNRSYEKMGKKRKVEEVNGEDNEFEPAPKHLTVKHVKNQEKRLILVLEGAQLESVKVKKTYKICLN